MNIMALLEQASLLVQRGQTRQAVALILDAETPDAGALADALHEIATWDDALLTTFARHDKQYLIDGKFGRFWLSPARAKRRIMPPAPVLVARELKTLAQAVVATVAMGVAA